MLVSSVFIQNQNLWAILRDNCFFRYVYKDQETACKVMKNIKSFGGFLEPCPGPTWLGSVNDCLISSKTVEEVETYNNGD